MCWCLRLIFAVLYFAELNAQQGGGFIEASAADLDAVVPAGDMYEMAAAVFPIDAIRLCLIGDADTFESPAVDWFAVISVLHDDPVSTGRSGPHG